MLRMSEDRHAKSALKLFPLDENGKKRKTAKNLALQTEKDFSLIKLDEKESVSRRLIT